MPLCRIFLLLLLFGSSSLGADLRTLAGKTMTGEVVGINDKSIILKTEAGEVATPLADVLELKLQDPGSLPSGTKYSDVELIDGTMLHCTRFAIKKREAELTVVPGIEVRLPLASISYILSGADDAKLREEWQKFLPKRGNRDILVPKTGGVGNFLEGTFGEGDEKGTRIEFERAGGGKVLAQLTQIVGLVFFRKADQLPSTDKAFKVHDANRNLLVATKLALGPKGYTITTACGAKVDYLDANKQLVARLDYSGGKLTFLSALEPIRVEETSNVDRIDHYRRDKNLEDRALKLANMTDENGTSTVKTFGKGLALHSRTVLVYDIGGDYKDFKALLGVDEDVGGDSRVKLLIEGDNRELFSTEVKRGDKPRPITLDVKGVRHLRITVSSEFLDLGNHLDLVEARVSK
ncbi:MAG TPA: NPCBM/NEW2 domain-containing protein [Gemmataceae bacterium]|nr:NPCBM/NEW2 domain-containing protein [Gemmataceae bacterium]